MKLFDRFFFLIGRLIRLLIRAICKKCQVNIYGLEEFAKLAEKESCIFVVWHQHILLADYGVVPSRFKSVVLSDAHYLGKIASGFARYSKAIDVSPSPSAKHKALIKLIRHLSKERAACYIAADGPLGPARSPKLGCIAIAKKLGVKIVPCSWDSTRSWFLPGWDRMQVPKPGSRIAILIGPPLDVSSLSLEEGSQALENALNELEEEAHASVRSSG